MPVLPDFSIGVAVNRSCPPFGLAPVTILGTARGVLRRLLCTHLPLTRSIPNRGPCLPNTARRHRGAETRCEADVAWLQDRWEDVWRSLTQLVLGTDMVWDAHRLRLRERYFEVSASLGREERAASVRELRNKDARPAVLVHKTSPEAPMSSCGGDSG